MKKEIYIELCQRLRGLRAAQKNLHYAFEFYGDHMITDRFAEGDDGGFSCNGLIDEIQECIAMYFGDSIDEVEIDTYPEDYSLSLQSIESREQSFGVISDLFRSLIEFIDSNVDSLSAGEQNLLGAIAQSAMRAKAFYDRVRGKTDGNQESASEGLAAGSSTRSDSVVRPSGTEESPAGV